LNPRANTNGDSAAKMALWGGFDAKGVLMRQDPKLPTGPQNKMDQEDRQELDNSHHKTMMRCLR
jgi:hypothetical protein